MLFSVVIPTCNRNDLLGKCLDCLAPEKQSVHNFIFEVIITDDGKNNQAKELILNNYPWARWVEGPKNGPAANRNNGAKYAKGEWLIFIDDDVLPENNILQNYKIGIEEYPECLAFEGAIFPDDWELLKRDMSECPVNINGGCFWSANICVERQLFEEVGKFDEQFLIAAQEDQDFYYKVKKKTNVKFLGNCRVIHAVRIVSLRKKVKRIPIEIANWYLYEKKNVGFLSCLFRGLSSQIISFFSNFKSLKPKNMVYNFFNLILLLPVLLYSRLIKSK